ncbi:hypothetical protein VTK56DRAFT_5703 [Thermocarpiscus australiensis]
MSGSETPNGVPSRPPSPPLPDGVLPSDVPIEDEAGSRLKRGIRRRLLRGPHRMSSSPSLAHVGRPMSASSPYSISGTMSCISLASSASPFGQPSAGSYFFQSSAADSWSAHTSIPTSPDGSPGVDGTECARPIRKTECAAPASTTVSLPAEIRRKTKTFNIWAALPLELKAHVLSFLRPKDLVRASRVSKEFHQLCFDGQQWTSLDASEFYKEIPAESLAKIIVSAGPFIRNLNLRGCVQVEHYKRAEAIAKACRNLVHATLEGCRNFQRSTLHGLLRANEKLAHLNLTGLAAVNNATCKIIAHSCPQLEVLNVSWCKQMDARGVRFLVEGCPKLRDLRAGEVRGFNNSGVAEAIFRTNNLERLVLAGCDDLNDTALQTMIQGPDPEINYLTNRPMVAPRKLRHLNLSRCSRLTSNGVGSLAYLVPSLEGLQLSGVTHLTDDGLEPVLASTPRLTHLDLEDLPGITNALLSQHLAKAPCAPRLEHLNISYCEDLGDSGMLPVIRNCTSLKTVFMDNTRVSDLTLAEATIMVRERSARRLRRSSPPSSSSRSLPFIGLSLVVYDCQNITWPGVREVLSRNTEPPPLPPPRLLHNKTKDKEDEAYKGKGKAPIESREPDPNADDHDTSESNNNNNNNNNDDDDDDDDEPPPPPPPPQPTTPPPSLPSEIISLKCYHGWQMTVDEHTKRVLRGDLPAARRLERKWADFMQANEEAGVAGAAGRRRRRRRAREAQMVHDEEGGGGGGVGGGWGGGVGGIAGGGGGAGRRRARTLGSCAVM